MLSAVRQLGGKVTAVVVGPRGLADTVAAKGPDRVLWFAVEEGFPPEAYGTQVAEAAKTAGVRVVLSSDVPSGRVLLGMVAAQTNSAVVGSIRSLAEDGDSLLVGRSVADGRAVETLEVTGSLAGIFDGKDVDLPPGQPATVEEVPVRQPDGALRVVETLPASAESAGLLSAERVVGAGSGIRAKEDLELIRQLATAVGAEIACSLPVCDDMRWFESARVVGSSHHQIAPALYIAVGISGQPQHMSGLRDAKVIVAVNNDPEARIFKHCNYGIVGDLYKVVPALAEEFRNAC
nr:electron transfer flavoprotein subunit alpha/FixB family protein [Desulfovibrio sp. Huiquan2017]